MSTFFHQMSAMSLNISKATIKVLCVLTVFFLLSNVYATNWYIDRSASGAGNGTSWKDAWSDVTLMKGIQPGDTVFISGGPQGSSQTYSFSGGFDRLTGFAQGTATQPVTYTIGQDPLHNGTVIFNQTSVGGTYGYFVYSISNVIISGDAGDGAKHFKLSGTFTGLLTLNGTNSNVRLAYFDLSSGLLNLGSINPANKVELDHIDILINDLTASNVYAKGADRALYAKFTGLTWDDNKIHHCVIQIPHKATAADAGIGADGLQVVGTGYSLYENKIIGYAAPGYTFTQHQDGWQATGNCSYIKIYNNTTLNIGNYSYYAEGAFGTYSHLWIYNNLVMINDPYVAAGATAAVVVSGKTSGTMLDILIANNTVVDMVNVPPNVGRPVVMVNSATVSWMQCYAYNNFFLNCGNPEITGQGISAAKNIQVTDQDAPKYVYSYKTNGGELNDLHLMNVPSPVSGTGENLSSYFTFDKDGVSRRAVGAWDVGAYQVLGGPIVAPSNAATAIEIK